MGLFAALLAGALGWACAYAPMFMGSWVALIFSGELGDTPANEGRSRRSGRFLGFAAIGFATVIAGFVVAGTVGLLPHGWGWLGFVGIALATSCLIVGADVARLERRHQSYVEEPGPDPRRDLQ